MQKDICLKKLKSGFSTIILLSILCYWFGVLVRQELVGGIKEAISKTALAIVEMPGQLRGAFIAKGQ